MSPAAIVKSAQAAGVQLLARDDHIFGKPAGALSAELREAVRVHKQELLAILPNRPYVTASGDLIISSAAPYRYRWWDGGQCIADTLLELDVSAEVWGRYVDRPFPGRPCPLT